MCFQFPLCLVDILHVHDFELSVTQRKDVEQRHEGAGGKLLQICERLFPYNSCSRFRFAGFSAESKGPFGTM